MSSALITLVSISTQAAVVASDDASQSAYSDGWQGGDNGGSGWGSSWTLNSFANGGAAGFFVGSSGGNGGGNIDTGSSKSWGMYANSGGSPLSEAIRSFNGTLSVGQSVSLKMDNGFVNSGGTVGFGLRNSSGVNRFELFFVGGESFYKYNDGTSSTATSIGFTRDGIQITFTQNAANGFSVSIVSGASSASYTGTMSGSDIDRIRFFNSNSGSGSDHDLFFNSLQLVPEPTNVALTLFGVLACAGGVWSRVRRSRSVTMAESHTSASNRPA
ncbi:MAG: hypothetical protein EPO07_02735 [Verrucomicrobia bacterium]|nr:MAG: hypothetical protein EPO07_02735 [Verrucomicrobiota bacterium]